MIIEGDSLQEVSFFVSGKFSMCVGVESGVRVVCLLECYYEYKGR